MLIQVFQCLLIGGENAGPGALKNAESFVITDEQFESFIQRHRSVPQLVPESNTTMRDSYLILDEYVSHSSILRLIFNCNSSFIFFLRTILHHVASFSGCWKIRTSALCTLFVCAWLPGFLYSITLAMHCHQTAYNRGPLWFLGMNSRLL